MNQQNTTIVLAHGILGFGELFGLPLPVEYFNGVADHLRAQELDVIVPQVQTVGSVAARGKALRRAILGVPDSNDVHIIAHSMGGLDARSALTHDDVTERVRTLVTIGTPHAGSPVADAIVNRTGPLFDRIAELPPPIFELLQANAGGLQDLTTDAATQFNATTRDPDSVRYVEVAGDASRGGHELLLLQLAAVVGELHGVNDGVVTRDSALRKDHKHLPDWPVDHVGEQGWTTRTALHFVPDWQAHLTQFLHPDWQDLFAPDGVVEPASDLQAHLARYDALLAECLG